MRKQRKLRQLSQCVMTLLIVLTLAAFRTDRSVPPADMVVRYARVYTVDEKQPWAEAVAVRGDRIVWVGSDAASSAYIGSSTKVVNADGRLLLPGFVDSHFHV